ALARRLGASGFEEWISQFTWNRIVDKYEELYLSLAPTVGAVYDRAQSQPQKACAVIDSLEFNVPMVSVVIPCYKQSHYVTDAIESVFAQTYRNFEIIVVDDGSPDDVRAVVERLIARHPQLKLRVVSQTNQGLSASRNTGIREAAGEFILPLDAD